MQYKLTYRYGNLKHHILFKMINYISNLKDCISLELISVKGLFYHWDDHDDWREGILLNFGDKNIIVQTNNDTSELIFLNQKFEINSETEDIELYYEKYLTDEKPYCDFIGKKLLNWWLMKNNQGYMDGFMLKFNFDSGLCFIAMNNIVTVQSVSGEDFS